MTRTEACAPRGLKPVVRVEWQQYGHDAINAEALA